MMALPRTFFASRKHEQPARLASGFTYATIPATMWRSNQDRYGTTHHGGLTPAALDEDVPRCNCVTRAHGGLTNAAPVHVRLCIVKVAILPADERARTRAGGVSPPWFRYRDCTGVRQRTGDTLLNSGGSAIASASARRTAG